MAFSDSGMAGVSGLVEGLNQSLQSYLGGQINQQQKLQAQQSEFEQQQQQQQQLNDQRVQKLKSLKPVYDRMLGDQKFSDDEWNQITQDPEVFNSATALLEKHMDKIQAAKDKASAKADRDQESDDKDQQELFEKGSNHLIQVRGDKSVTDSETMRNASIQALGTINQAERENPNGVMNPAQYVDTITQLYRAKNGSAPDVESLKEMKQKTAKGDYGSMYTFLTGEPAPATTKDVQSALKQFILDTGEQADRIHEGAMNPREIINPGLKGKYLQRLQDDINQGRGTTFKDYRAKFFHDYDSADEVPKDLPPGTKIQIRGRYATLK